MMKGMKLKYFEFDNPAGQREYSQEGFRQFLNALQTLAEIQGLLLGAGKGSYLTMLCGKKYKVDAKYGVVNHRFSWQSKPEYPKGESLVPGLPGDYHTVLEYDGREGGTFINWWEHSHSNAPFLHPTEASRIHLVFRDADGTFERELDPKTLNEALRMCEKENESKDEEEDEME